MFNFLTDKFSAIFSKISGNNKLTENNIDEALQQVGDALLEADVPYDLVKQFTQEIKDEAIGQKVLKSLNPGQQFIKVVHDRLKDFLGGQSTSPITFQIPSILMVMGLQGSGKTTTIAKLANFLKKTAIQKGKQRKILLASVDFYRPAAVDQLEVLSKQVEVDFYRSEKTDILQAAKDIYSQFKNKQYDYLLLDTAGRLHIDNNLLKELQDIDLALSPKYKVLVLDSMTGQESLKVAQAFDQAVGFHSAILTKLDSEARSGSAFAFRYALKKPIAFIGSGEKIDDLEQFHPDRMATRILGMGDVLSLIEKAEEKINKSEQEEAARAFMSGKFSLEDFAKQMEMVNRLGSLSKIAQYIPGLGGMKLPQDAIEKGEKEMKKFRAIISSMTPKERTLPRILDASRKQRVARGSGTAVSDINLLLERFEQSQQFVRLLKKVR